MAFRLLILALLLSCEVAWAQDFAADRGRRFAQANCSHCHAIGRFGESPLPIAPPFRTLHEKYPVEYLEEAFAEGIVSGHPSMPQFELPPDQIRDLIAYLKSLEE
jgi:cytochrome c